MENTPKNGAPTSAAKHRGESAKQDYSSRGIKASLQSATFSGVILRALDARPDNEDRLRGIAP
ncbi:MAG: hypothetical protein WC343_02930 [Bacilli bacterium]|jgi:hypothetical protein